MAFDEVTADIFSDVNDNTAIYLFDEFLKGLCEEFDEGNYRNLTLKDSLVRKTDNRTIASKTFYIYSYGATVKIPAFRNPARWSHNRMSGLNRHKKIFEGITGKKYDWKAYTNKLKQVI